MRKSLYDRGERTRVSQAATVKVHTKKYFWAERWGGRLREGGRIEAGSSPDIAGSVVPVLERVKERCDGGERKEGREGEKVYNEGVRNG